MTFSALRPGRFAFLLLAAGVAACSDDSTGVGSGDFLQGTGGNPQIGLVVNSARQTLTLFQLGKPSETREIPFGASSAVTPTGFAFRGTHAAVPLGDAASTALVDLDGLRIERFFTFTAGNATGVAFVDDTTFVVANLIGQLRRARSTFGQASSAIHRHRHRGRAGADCRCCGGRKGVRRLGQPGRELHPARARDHHGDRSGDHDAHRHDRERRHQLVRRRRWAPTAWSTW